MEFFLSQICVNDMKQAINVAIYDEISGIYPDDSTIYCSYSYSFPYFSSTLFVIFISKDILITKLKMIEKILYVSAILRF